MLGWYPRCCGVRQVELGVASLVYGGHRDLGVGDQTGDKAKWVALLTCVREESCQDSALVLGLCKHINQYSSGYIS